MYSNKLKIKVPLARKILAGTEDLQKAEFVVQKLKGTLPLVVKFNNEESEFYYGDLSEFNKSLNNPLIKATGLIAASEITFNEWLLAVQQLA